jgi:hypothetical protein
MTQRLRHCSCGSDYYGHSGEFDAMHGWPKQKLSLAVR